MLTCPSCRGDVAADDYFCANCGTPLKTDEAGSGDETGVRHGTTTHEPHDHAELVLSSDFAGITDRGRRHTTNEDALLIAEGPSPAGTVRLLVVCDGVSSASAADLASAAAVCAFRDAALTAAARGDSMTGAMSLGSQAAQAAVCALPAPLKGDPPATTLMAAMVCGRRMVLAWAGDSRAYLLTPTPLLLTHDDSWFNLAVDRGAMTAEQAMNHPFAHAITNCLGLDGEDEVFTPHIEELDLPPRTILLLCTDGLWNYAEAAEDLAGLLSVGDRNAEALGFCRRLVDFANGQGGRDNISVAVLRVRP